MDDRNAQRAIDGVGGAFKSAVAVNFRASTMSPTSQS
jgi:hypothetical protein